MFEYTKPVKGYQCQYCKEFFEGIYSKNRKTCFRCRKQMQAIYYEKVYKKRRKKKYDKNS